LGLDDEKEEEKEEEEEEENGFRIGIQQKKLN